MGSREAPESFHSVTLSIERHSYTAHLWRGGPAQWRLLSVEVCGVAIPVLERVDFASCRASLEAAERAVIAELAEQKSGHRGAA
jgi:hypothetical protein